MGRDRDIHKIDNYLIRFGWIVLVIAGLAAFDSDAGAVVFWALAASLLMLGVGYYVRRQEKTALMIWDILERTPEVRVDDLVSSTGLTRDSLRTTLAVVNAQPGAYFVWDIETDIIVDGRLRQRVAHVDTCGNCGAQVNVTLALDRPDAPNCSYCGAPVAKPADLGRMRRQTLADAPAAARPKKEFSVLLFIVLLFVFWPAAVGYALWKAGILDPLLEKANG